MPAPTSSSFLSAAGFRSLVQRLSPVLGHFLLLVGASTGIFLGGAPPEGHLGIFLVVAGLALIACPPQGRLDGPCWALGAGLVLAASLSLLPHGWFPEPAWRARLLTAGVPLGAAVTPMPEETWFWVRILALTVSVALFGLAQPLRSRWLLALTALAIAVCATYAGLAMYIRETGWAYRFDGIPRDFGFIGNPNNTSTFLVVGSVLALGVLGVALRGGHWLAGLVAAVGLAVCGTGLIFFTTSRGGILALVVSMLLWLAGLGAGHRSKPLLVSFACVFLATGIFFLASESAVQQRILLLLGLDKRPQSGVPAAGAAPAPAAEGQMPRDSRRLIFSDTARMVREAPLTGLGLGTFRWISAQYQERFLWESPLVHPESDWTMLAAEAGLPTVLLFFGAIAWLLRRVWPQRRHPYWPLRWGILCAVLAALLQGLVNVPAHSVALGWWVVVLGGMGLQIAPREGLRPSRLQHGVFVLAGFGALIFGVQLIRAQWLGGPTTPLLAGLRASIAIGDLSLEGRWPEAAKAAQAAQERWPLNGDFYSTLGGALIELGRPAAEVDAVFRAQRAILPGMPYVPLMQGWAWSEADPGRTAELWFEAIADRRRIAERAGRGPEEALQLFRTVLRDAAALPDLQRHLLRLAMDRSEFVLAWLEQNPPDLVAAEIPGLVAEAGFIRALAKPDRRRFLSLWYRKGDREDLFRFVGEHADWSTETWPVQIQRLVDAARFEEAVQALAQRFGVVLALGASGAGSQGSRIDEAVDPAGAFQAAWSQGNTVSARRILKEATARREAPVEVWRLAAAFAAQENQWASAWRDLDRYVRQAHPGDWP